MTPDTHYSEWLYEIFNLLVICGSTLVEFMVFYFWVTYILVMCSMLLSICLSIACS